MARSYELDQLSLVKIGQGFAHIGGKRRNVGVVFEDPFLFSDSLTGNIAFVSISTGGTHACGTAASGNAYCWGNDGSGQLGDGKTATSLIPTAVSTNVQFIAVSAGSSHTCALTSAGAAYCWGKNQAGQLGNGNLADLSAGNDHTCGVTHAGVAYCWGLNSSGQLGDGTHNNSSVPVPVTK